ncbi:TetR/AcrR family transcriptional regulator [Streptomyces sp. BV286]|uniref:TetR/AcrR family transcriptional regulator n=1 Tax=Streptomyces sp. BV286 TaxID=2849672 RepID=UPI001C2E0EE2|nr:TetR/AcrR family transcriptional regulator [Streptomyces sp. BV286]MBV1940446.1 TetR/AcrR family transcriptional regulator [Streptomyces sp. BV286]
MVSGDVRTRTRDIARAAVRAELGQVAIGLFQREGFAKVTINDVAAAAGVSRNTFLRYFGTKEDAVLGAFDAQGQRVADALRARPAGEDDWTVLRHALDTIVEDYRRDPGGTLATARLIQETPALRARRLEKQCGWRPLLAQALAERTDPPSLPTDLDLLVRAAAALDCLEIAVDQWAASDGRLALDDLIDQAFAALAAR